jgi:ribosomal-protein-alanine N-acetyltransferase
MRILKLRMQQCKAVCTLPANFLVNTAGQSASVQCSVRFSIRDFHSDDFEVLWRIDQQCFSPGIAYSRPELAAYIRMAGAFTLVAEAQQEEVEEPSSPLEFGQGEACRVVGFIVASLNARRAGHIITIDVLAEGRRSGIGSALLQAAEQRLRSAGCGSVRLETAVNNISALVFYKRHQYSVTRTIQHYYPDGVDAFVMRKDLLSEPSDG